MRERVMSAERNAIQACPQTVLRRTWLRFVCFLPLFLLPLSLRADEQVDYVNQIKPLLRERCYACHGALKQEGGLRLDTAVLAIKGGESGAALTPNNAAESLLLKRVTAQEESDRMPPPMEGEALTTEQVA
jgi:hypothetical protein